MEPGQFAGILLGVNAAVLVVLCVLFVGKPAGDDRRALLGEAFEHRKTLKMKYLYPAKHGLPDEELAAVRQRLNDVYKDLDYPTRAGADGKDEARIVDYRPGGPDTYLLFGLMGIVTLWCLYTPRRVGFQSGQSIQR